MKPNITLMPRHPRSRWSAALQAATAGTCASVLSAAVLLLAGRREAGSAAAPLNAVSHWYWGDEALGQQQTDVQHTVVGYLTHHAASVFWAALLSAFLQREPREVSLRKVMVSSAVTSALACAVDFKMTPKRLTPGFEHRLSRKTLGGTYLLFAVGLAIGSLLIRAKRHDR
ncbi:hypothetical protein ACDW_04010 [Acidovorax sp. DW039]|nr:hypothetical protein ACDW_04010 [Acidovorax sp. DW039]